MSQLSHITIIANPTSQSGYGATAAQKAYEQFKAKAGAGCIVDLVHTQSPGHATELAKSLGVSTELLVAVGGDGLVHEVGAGLMELRETEGDEKAPVLAVVPAGSGNDYANTLGMSEKISQAVEQILNGKAVRADVGRCNGQYFMETLSFGIDAAIGLDTVERRKKTGHHGARLYAESAIDQLINHRESRGYRATVDGREYKGTSLIFAVQVGPTYGGGFCICPDARIDDGLLDVCVAEGPLSLPAALLAFARVKPGKHTNMDIVTMTTGQNIHIEFETEPPAQMDGEKVEGRIFDVSLVPSALSVISAR